MHSTIIRDALVPFNESADTRVRIAQYLDARGGWYTTREIYNALRPDGVRWYYCSYQLTVLYRKGVILRRERYSKEDGPYISSWGEEIPGTVYEYSRILPDDSGLDA